MEKRRIWITLIMILLGTGVCLSTSLFSRKKSVEIKTNMESSEASLKNVETTVILEASETVSSFPVYICGEVVEPGVYELFDPVYLYELVEIAGGLTDSADEEHIDMVYIIETAQSIYIPSVSSSDYENDDLIDTQTDRWTPRTGTGTSSARRVNINDADVQTLMTLTGIGEKTAEKIVTYREQNGPFAVKEDIMKVPGIGESKYETIKNSICV